MKRFSDFATDNNTVTGDKIKIEEVLNKEIEVLGYKINDSKYPKNGNDKVLTLHFKLNGVDRILFTGSNVLLDQAEKYKSEMPFVATITKVDKYYTFS